MITEEMQERRRTFPLSNIEHQAYCVWHWLSGMTQREIALQFGYGSSTPVSTAILRFNWAMDAWEDDEPDLCSKDVARRALHKFLTRP